MYYIYQGFVAPSFNGMQTAEQGGTIKIEFWWFKVEIELTQIDFFILNVIVVIRSNVVMMASRFNAKKSKRQRNRENMARFRTKRVSIFQNM